MIELTLPALIDYIGTIIHLAIEGLRLNPEAYKLVYEYTGENTGIMFWILFIAGISLLLGQCATLFANRVSTGRFFVSIVLGALKFLVDVFVVIFSVWAMANLIGSKQWEFLPVARAVALSFSPYWLGFLLFMPYFGLIMERFLKAYVFLALVVALQTVFLVSFLGAVVAAFIAVSLSHLITTFLGRLLTPIAHRITTRIFGDLEIKDSQEILNMFIQRHQALYK